MLVHPAFGEDVDPGVPAVGVGGWSGEDVAAGGAVAELGGGKGVASEVHGRGRRERHGVGGAGKRTGGEETDGLRHGRLEEAAQGGMIEAMAWEDLAEGEEV